MADFDEFREVVVDELEFCDKIGGGGAGLVYKVQWKGNYYAAKVLIDPNVEESIREAFTVEYLFMKDLHHPNIISVLGANMRPPKLLILMELCQCSLFVLLHQTRSSLTQQMIINMACDVADAMIYLHSRSPIIVHRDLKSHNLLVDSNYKLKLCDFGLASNASRHAGTPAYMAPELFKGGQYSKKVDVYAFGILLWEMLCQQVPFDSIEPREIRRRILEGERPEIPRFGIVDDFKSLIQDCWDEDQEMRPDFEEIRVQLDHIQSLLSSTTSHTEAEVGDSLDALLSS